MFFLFGVTLHANAKGTDSLQGESEPDKPLFDDIRNFAARMEVFPMDIYAGMPAGPLGWFTVIEKLTGQFYMGWKYRYELTFDRYIPMFEFKDRVYRATAEEIDACIHRIDEMTPKEKALLFTAIYIFERCRRPIDFFEHYGRPIPSMSPHEMESLKKRAFFSHTVLSPKFDFSMDKDVKDQQVFACAKGSEV